MALVSNAAASREEELRRLMPPPPPRPPSVVTAPKPKPAVVLDEDTYTQQLEAIIERDYFPELPKMANQLEWLRAVNSGDIREMQRAQRNIARRRAAAAAAAAGGGTTPAVGGIGGETPGMLPPFATPGTAGGWGSATPGTALLRTPAMTPMVGASGGQPEPAVGGPSAAAAAVAATAAAGGPAAAGMSLDAFLQNYTSEDNASFQAILEEDNRRKRAKVKHHLERPDPRDPEVRQLLLEGPKDRPSDEFGSTGQAPMTLLPAPEPVVNALFYDSSQRPAVPFSAKELADQALGPPKAINKAGTRLKVAPEELPQAATATAAAAAAAAAMIIAAAGGDGAEGAAAAAAAAAAVAAGLPVGAPLPAAAGGGTAGYAPMATPALDEVLASPLMTWGDIESTPLRLGADDMPVTLDLEALVGGGPAFRVQGLTEREQAAHKLAAAKAGSGSAASRATSARGSTPLLTALRRAATGTGGGAGATARKGPGGATPLAVPLSPAARQLAANIKAASMTPRGAGGSTVAGTAPAAAAAPSAPRGGCHHHGGYNHRGGNYHNGHHQHRGAGGSSWRGAGGGRTGQGWANAGGAAAAAAATAATAAAARNAALGSGELDKQLQASYRSGSATAGRGSGTPAAAAGTGTAGGSLARGHTPGVAVGGAAAAATGGRRTPVVVGMKRTTAGTGPTASVVPAALGAAVNDGSRQQSVTDDLLKL